MYVQPACLPINGEDTPQQGETGWANGWGLTRGFGPDNKVLKQVAVRIHDDAQCMNFQPDYKQNIGFICGGGTFGHDTVSFKCCMPILND